MRFKTTNKVYTYMSMTFRFISSAIVFALAGLLWQRSTVLLFVAPECITVWIWSKPSYFFHWIKKTLTIWKGHSVLYRVSRSYPSSSRDIASQTRCQQVVKRALAHVVKEILSTFWPSWVFRPPRPSRGCFRWVENFKRTLIVWHLILNFITRQNPRCAKRVFAMPQSKIVV